MMRHEISVEQRAQRLLNRATRATGLSKQMIVLFGGTLLSITLLGAITLSGPVRRRRLMGDYDISGYYETLGVLHTATAREIKKSFNKLALKSHPDRGVKDATKFREIQEAYEVLSNPEERGKYDFASLPKVEKSQEQKRRDAQRHNEFKDMMKDFKKNNRSGPPGFTDRSDSTPLPKSRTGTKPARPTPTASTTTVLDEIEALGGTLIKLRTTPRGKIRVYVAPAESLANDLANATENAVSFEFKPFNGRGSDERDFTRFRTKAAILARSRFPALSTLKGEALRAAIRVCPVNGKVWVRSDSATARDVYVRGKLE